MHRYQPVGVPDSSNPVLRGRQDSISVRTERNASHGLYASFELKDPFSALGVPYPGRLVSKRGCDAIPVRTEPRAEGESVVAGKVREFFSAARVPHLRA